MNNANFDPAIINMFKQEAKKHILKVNTLLLAIEKDEGGNESFTEIKREVHTLKGDSRMLGFTKISEASHKMEDLFELMIKSSSTLDHSMIQNIFKGLDSIDKAIDALPDNEIDIEIGSFLDGNKTPEKKVDDGKIEIFSDDIKKGKTDPSVKDQKEKQIDEKESGYININLKKIDELINLYSSFPRYSGRFSFLVNQMKSFRNNVEYKYHDDELVKTIDMIIYNFSHEITFYDLASRQFQTEITKMKLVPLSTIFDLFPRLVRDIAFQTGKKINFSVSGRDVELDKVVVEKLKDVLIHIINNSVDHGCEKPEERIKAGKPETGNIRLHAYSKGDNVIIEISDDGYGLDIKKIREKAVEKGMITKKQSDASSDEEMIKYIFEPGFSTKDVGKFSGRGIGMDVVSTTVSELNGTINVDTWKDKGTTFTISLPLISFFIPVTIFTLDEYTFGLPSSYIIQTLRIKNSDVSAVSDTRKTICVNNDDISIINLMDFFGFNCDDTEQSSNVIMVKSNDEMSALTVNDIVIEKKMVIKKLTGMFDKFGIIIGSVLMGSERAIPVLNIPELFRLFKQNKSGVTKIKTAETKRKIWAKNILLVEDSPVTRDHEKKILLNQNINVFEASNGKEAVKFLESGHKFDLIITDIEMPVMDGVELIKFIKNKEPFSSLPVLVVSSYKDHAKKLFEMGVDRFINKSDFNAADFVEALKELNII
jgi:two-component system, chemotaxis family, sensor kinase CheA